MLVGAAGYRWFVFKSDLDFDFHGPVGSLDLRWTRESPDGASDWELTDGRQRRAALVRGPAATSDGRHRRSARRDTFLVGHVEVTRAGRVLVGAGYALQWNARTATATR